MQSVEQILCESTYTSCYCEQNVYLMCKQLYSKGIQSYAVFLTNPDKRMCIRQQTNGNHQHDYMAVWDYHVILISKIDKKWIVFDKDSRLWAVSFQEYYQKALKTKYNQPKTLFRVVKCESYLQSFASDRSHMLKNGKYSSPPPEYECIKNKNGDTMNLNSYLNCKDIDQKFGQLMTAQEYIQYFI